MIKCTYSLISRNGGRKVNEDACRVALTKGRLNAVLADGLGGQGDGEIASHLAVENAMPMLEGGLMMTARRMREAFHAGNAAVLKERQARGNRMMTTLAVVSISGRRVTSGHVGDSRVYWFRDGKVLFQSLDHSLCQVMALSGEIKQEEIRGHASRNLLLRALGEKQDVQADVHSGWLRKGDRLLICSDGLWDLVYEEEMIQAAKAGGSQAWLDRMCELVEQRQQQDSDNYTAITITVE